MLQLPYSLIHTSVSALQVICFITAWTIIVFFVWSSFSAAKDGVATVKRLHQIPCSDCQFFTGSYQLKCPVHPTIALTEEAINCSDYYPPRSRSSHL